MYPIIWLRHCSIYVPHIIILCNWCLIPIWNTSHVMILWFMYSCWPKWYKLRCFVLNRDRGFFLTLQLAGAVSQPGTMHIGCVMSISNSGTRSISLAKKHKCCKMRWCNLDADNYDQYDNWNSTIKCPSTEYTALTSLYTAGPYRAFQCLFNLNSEIRCQWLYDNMHMILMCDSDWRGYMAILY